MDHFVPFHSIKSCITSLTGIMGRLPIRQARVKGADPMPANYPILCVWDVKRSEKKLIDWSSAAEVVTSSSLDCIFDLTPSLRQIFFNYT